ncbi:hypothetical protein [Mycobacterium sp. SMC-17]
MSVGMIDPRRELLQQVQRGPERYVSDLAGRAVDRTGRGDTDE